MPEKARSHSGRSAHRATKAAEVMDAAAQHDGLAEMLADSLRRLMDAAVVTAADDDLLETAIDAIDAVAAQLEGVDGELLRSTMPWPSRDRMQRGDRPHNPVVGPANPLSPPMPIRVLDDGSVISEITMRPIHEGPPGAVHGGWVASLLDQLLGIANTVANVGGMTAELTVRYRKATPYDVPLTIRARTDSADGRKIYASGEILVDGAVTAEATGVFIRPSEARIAQLTQLVEERG
jgi:acyl-coenzyme A thioesterase PaaI-like protein